MGLFVVVVLFCLWGRNVIVWAKSSFSPSLTLVGEDVYNSCGGACTCLFVVFVVALYSTLFPLIVIVRFSCVFFLGPKLVRRNNTVGAISMYRVM